MYIRIMALDMHTDVMIVNLFPNGNTYIHERLNTLSFIIKIVSSEKGQEKKRMFLECRWYPLRLDRSINIAKVGINVLCYLYSWEVVDRIVPHKHAETIQRVEEHNTYCNTYRLLKH